MDIVLPVIGALIVLAVLQDLFTTVLFPASGRGLIRKPLTRATGTLFRAAGRRLSGARRRNVLAYSGPTLIALTSSSWFLLLTIGFALIYAPALGGSIVASDGPTDRSFTTALYVSGFTLTTLGTGDVVPTTGTYRVLTILEAGIGFLTFSMAVSYFLSVYSNLTSRNAFALQLHHRCGGTGDGAVLVAGMAEGADISARGFLASAAAALREVHETHRSYPVLRHFHYRRPEYALPGVVLTVLDTTTLLRSMLDEVRYARLLRSAELAELVAAAHTLLAELAPAHARDGAGLDERDAAWHRRVRRAAPVLAASGLRLRPEAAGAAAYVALRSTWDPPFRAFAAEMSYDEDDVTLPDVRG